MTDKKRKGGNRRVSDTKLTEQAESPSTSDKPAIKPKHFKRTAQEQITKSYKTIVETFAKEAEGGSVQHTKILFDLGDVKKEVAAASSKRRSKPSLGKLLIEEVKTMKREKSTAPPISGS
jgi:hypothetical protein